MKILATVLNTPYNIAGLVLAFISIPIRFRVFISDYALVINVRSLWWHGNRKVRAATLGQVVMITSKELDSDLAHELVHVEQILKQPLIQPIIYLFENIKHGYKNNKYEIEAYKKSNRQA